MTGFNYVRLVIIMVDDLIALTPAQAIKLRCAKVSLKSLSNLYQDILLFRFDTLKGEIYILAGQNLEIIIDTRGTWEFLPNETEF